MVCDIKKKGGSKLKALFDTEFYTAIFNEDAKIEGTPVASEASEFGYRFESSSTRYDSSSSNLSNGDVVVIAAYIQFEKDPVQYCIDKYGKMPSALTKEYTVSGLTSYISSASEINEESLEKMKAKALEVYNEENEDIFYDGDTLSKFEYVGNYFLCCNEEQSVKNACVLVFNVTINHEYYGDSTKLCWYILYKNLSIDADGNINDDFDRNCRCLNYIEGFVYYGDSKHYIGCADIDHIYETVTVENLDLYTVETNINENLALHLNPEDNLEEDVDYTKPYGTETLN